MSSVPRSYRIRLLAIAPCVLLALFFNACRARVVPPTNPEDAPDSTEPATADGKHSVPEARFPRRLLFISIGDYAFLNPIASGTPEAAEPLRAAARRLAQELKVSTESNQNQLVLLTDTPTSTDTKLPTRHAIVDTYERFFSTCGRQDRIVVYFGGHALEVNGQAYLVPIEGERNDPKLLISLADFYAALKACPALQKIVIWDVCRFSPERGRRRAGSEPMTPALYKELLAAPEGVEVVTTCQPGENALELIDLTPNSPHCSGSAFLLALPFLATKSPIIPKAQNPTDPIPMADLIAAISKRVSEVTGSPRVNLKQTVRYFASGQNPGDVLPPGRPTVDKPLPKNGSAEVQEIVAEFRIPPLKGSRPPPVLTELPFREDVIAAYRADVSLDEIRKNKQKYEFRFVTWNALETLRDVWNFKPKGGLVQRETIAAPITSDLKRDLKKELDLWGIGIARLDEVDLALERIAAKKKEQPRRWQAHYDFARAAVKSRLAYMNEYDKLSGDVLTEILPPLDKTLNQNSYRLVPNEKMKSKKDIQKFAADAQEAYAAVIADYKDTPWAVQAEFEKSLPLGLIWQPIVRAK